MKNLFFSLKSYWNIIKYVLRLFIPLILCFFPTWVFTWSFLHLHTIYKPIMRIYHSLTHSLFKDSKKILPTFFSITFVQQKILKWNTTIYINYTMDKGMHTYQWNLKCTFLWIVIWMLLDWMEELCQAAAAYYSTFR